MSSVSKAISRLFPPLLVITVTATLVFFLNFEGPVKAKLLNNTELPTVEVVTINPQSLTLDIRANGVVTPRLQAKLVPEVSGKIEWVSEKWNNGGYFKKDEVFFKIAPNQYENYVAKAKAQLAEAKAFFIQEQGMAQVARREWNQRNRNSKKDSKTAARSLALREPQLESAQSKYEAALSDLALAEANLAKTSVIAPFDGILLKKVADMGQFISSTQVLGEFYAVDSAEIRIPLTESNQYLISIPALQGSKATPVEVMFTTKVGEDVYPAELVRTEAVLDEITKVLYAVISVNDPYQLNSKSDKPSLRIGSYVTVSIPGRKLDNLYILPPAVLRGGDRVYVVDNNSVLRSKPVTLQSNYNGLAIVSEGLEGEVSLVVGRFGEAMEGRKVNVSFKADSGLRALESSSEVVE